MFLEGDPLVGRRSAELTRTTDEVPTLVAGDEIELEDLPPEVVPAEVRKVAPLGDPMELRVRGYLLSIRRREAKHFRVEVERHA